MEVELTSKRMCSIWWAYFWRSSLISCLGGFAVGCMVGVVMAMILKGDDQMQTHEGKMILGFVMVLTSIIFGTILNVFVLKVILAKKFKDFKIALIAKE